MLIKACLNGARARTAHPALPWTPAQLADAAADAVAAGADALHFHPRDRNGNQSLRAADVDAAVGAVRDACPGIAVGVTTIASIEPDLARQIALIRAWRERPDFASVNFEEAGAIDVCRALLEQGVGIEPGLATVEEARLLVASGLGGRSVRVLLEPDEQDTQQALATVAAVEEVLDAAGISAPRLLHGFNATAWPLLQEALRRGLDTRIGLEDTLVQLDGGLAPDNATLVASAWGMARRNGRMK